jgi:hypothetical protein
MKLEYMAEFRFYGTLNDFPDYKDQSAMSKFVILAGIAEIQMPWMASANTSLCSRFRQSLPERRCC